MVHSLDAPFDAYFKSPECGTFVVSDTDHSFRSIRSPVICSSAESNDPRAADARCAMNNREQLTLRDAVPDLSAGEIPRNRILRKLLDDLLSKVPRPQDDRHSNIDRHLSHSGWSRF
jgi:hypothetical protein